MRRCDRIESVGETSDPRVANVRLTNGDTVRVTRALLVKEYGTEQCAGLRLCYDVDVSGNRFWPGKV